MAVTTVLPLGTYAPGTYNLGPANVPKNVTLATLELDRSAWLDPVVKVEASIDLSADNGQTWRKVCGFTAEGGVVIGRDGATVQKTRIFIPLGDPSSNARRIRAVVSITGGDLVTTGTMTIG